MWRLLPTIWEKATKVHCRQSRESSAVAARRSSHLEPVTSLLCRPQKKDKQPLVLWEELNDRNYESKWRQSLQRVQQWRAAHRGGDTLPLKINLVIHLYIYFNCTQQQVREKLAGGSEAPKKKKSAFGWKAIFTASNSTSRELIMQDFITASWHSYSRSCSTYVDHVWSSASFSRRLRASHPQRPCLRDTVVSFIIILSLKHKWQTLAEDSPRHATVYPPNLNKYCLAGERPRSPSVGVCQWQTEGK